MASLFSWKSAPEIAIDFGTANLRVIGRGDGILFDEPSLCAYEREASSLRLVAAGHAAQPMLDRVHGKIVMKRPLRRGVLQDIDAARELLRYAVQRAIGRQPRGVTSAILGVPADATQAEQGALLTAARDAVLGSVRLVPEPLAAAVGAQLPVDAPAGTMIVECGAGTTEVAVISLGGICCTRSVRGGGDALNQALADHIHHRHRFLIGEQTSNRIKRQLAAETDGAAMIELRGHSIASRLPATIHVSASELNGVVRRHVALIVDAVRAVLNETPPELSQDIHARGIILTGGSAGLPALASLLARATGLPITVAEEPDTCVVRGLQTMLAQRSTGFRSWGSSAARH